MNNILLFQIGTVIVMVYLLVNLARAHDQLKNMWSIFNKQAKFIGSLDANIKSLVRLSELDSKFDREVIDILDKHEAMMEKLRKDIGDQTTKGKSGKKGNT